MPPGIRQSSALFEGLPTSPAFPSDKSGCQEKSEYEVLVDRGKQNVEYWWNGTDRRKRNVEYWWNGTDRRKRNIEYWWNGTDRRKRNVEYWWNGTDRGK